MTAIMEISGTQVKVAPDALVKIPRIKEERGETIVCDKVLFVENGDDVRIGRPYLNDVAVHATVFAHDRTKKTQAGIYKKRKQYKKSWGFREAFTLLKVNEIEIK